MIHSFEFIPSPASGFSSEGEVATVDAPLLAKDTFPSEVSFPFSDPPHPASVRFVPFFLSGIAGRIFGWGWWA